MKESDLAVKFIEYFEGYDIYKEVPCAGIIDIYAVINNITTAIEVKVNLNFEVLEQAVKNKQYSHYSYIAVPSSKKNNFQLKIAKLLGVGVLFYYQYSPHASNILEMVKPDLNRKIYKPKLEQYMKQSVAGSQNDRVTAFGNTINEITHFLRRNRGSAHIKDVFKDDSYHWSSPSSAKQCVQRYCSKGIIKAFRYEKGVLILNEVSETQNPLFGKKQ